MRTGSNLLEATLNSVPGIACLGELYNPVFVGFPKRPEALGYNVAMREADPAGLFARLRDGAALNGFRWFHDHDPRAFDLAMADRDCAKIVLTRRPLDSYISLKIARQTGQWKLGDLRHRKDGLVSYDAAEFADYLAGWQAYQALIRRRLQGTGQTAFAIDYDDLGDVSVLNGLLAHLGVTGRLADLPQSLVPQNPGPVSAKVANYEAMRESLARLDPFGALASGLPEPLTGPGVPRFVAATGAPILFLPLAGGPTGTVSAWLASVGDATARGVRTGFTQGSLRLWMRDHPPHQSFSVLRHPVLRAFSAFAALAETDRDAPLRRQLQDGYKLNLPAPGTLGSLSVDDRRMGFLGFLKFLKGNLDGQTGVRTDPSWSSQSVLLAAMSQVVVPDLVAREPSLAQDLSFLGSRLALPAPVLSPALPDPVLIAICDDGVEKLVRQIYHRDYVSFGFGRLTDHT